MREVFTDDSGRGDELSVLRDSFFGGGWGFCAGGAGGGRIGQEVAGNYDGAGAFAGGGLGDGAGLVSLRRSHILKWRFRGMSVAMFERIGGIPGEAPVRRYGWRAIADALGVHDGAEAADGVEEADQVAEAGDAADEVFGAEEEFAIGPLIEFVNLFPGDGGQFHDGVGEIIFIPVFGGQQAAGFGPLEHVRAGEGSGDIEDGDIGVQFDGEIEGLLHGFEGFAGIAEHISGADVDAGLFGDGDGAAGFIEVRPFADVG